MAKFKVGDKIRLVKNPSGNWTIGKEMTILEVADHGYYTSFSPFDFCYEDDFELVKETQTHVTSSNVTIELKPVCEKEQMVRMGSFIKTKSNVLGVLVQVDAGMFEVIRVDCGNRFADGIRCELVKSCISRNDVCKLIGEDDFEVIKVKITEL